MKILKPLLAAVAFLQVALAGATGIYTYEWIGGQPGFSGQIILDAPSSAAALHPGTDGDVLPGSYVTTPLGTFNVLDRALDAEFGAGAPFWDESRISVISLFFDASGPVGNPYWGQPAVGSASIGFFNPGGMVAVFTIMSNGSIASAYVNDDLTGQWLAVPEPSGNLFLVWGGMAALAKCCGPRVRRRR